MFLNARWERKWINSYKVDTKKVNYHSIIIQLLFNFYSIFIQFLIQFLILIDEIEVTENDIKLYRRRRKED